MGELEDKLQAKIDQGKIIFDRASLRDELLRQNGGGTHVVPDLQELVLALCDLVESKIRISSLVRSAGHHGSGRAVDIGNEEIAAKLLPLLAKKEKVAELRIDELIFDAKVAGQANRNLWNYDRGQKHDYDTATLDRHKDHIHIAVLDA